MAQPASPRVVRDWDRPTAGDAADEGARSLRLEDLRPLVHALVDWHADLASLRGDAFGRHAYVCLTLNSLFNSLRGHRPARVSFGDLRASNVVDCFHLVASSETRFVVPFDLRGGHVDAMEQWGRLVAATKEMAVADAAATLQRRQAEAAASPSTGGPLQMPVIHLPTDGAGFPLVTFAAMQRARGGALTPYALRRIADGVPRRVHGGGAAVAVGRPSPQPLFCFDDFVWLWLAEKDRMSDSSIAYWFAVLDADGDGALSPADLRHASVAESEATAGGGGGAGAGAASGEGGGGGRRRSAPRRGSRAGSGAGPLPMGAGTPAVAPAAHRSGVGLRRGGGGGGSGDGGSSPVAGAAMEAGESTAARAGGGGGAQLNAPEGHYAHRPAADPELDVPASAATPALLGGDAPDAAAEAAPPSRVRSASVGSGGGGGASGAHGGHGRHVGLAHGLPLARGAGPDHADGHPALRRGPRVLRCAALHGRAARGPRVAGLGWRQTYIFVGRSAQPLCRKLR